MNAPDASDTGDRLSRSSTSDELAGLLREMIMTGRLQPDTSLREAALSAQFGVSRRTVRDALSVLGHEGLVRHHRHKGSRVTRFDSSDIRDLDRVRRTMELAAARTGDLSSEQHRQLLTAAFDRLSQATKVGDAAGIVQRELQFHQAVVGLLGSERVDRFFGTIAVETRCALSILTGSRQESKRRPTAALAEHRELYDALMRRDRRAAAKLITQHTDRDVQLLLKTVGA